MHCSSILAAGIKTLAELVPLRATSKGASFCFSYGKSLAPWLVDECLECGLHLYTGFSLCLCNSESHVLVLRFYLFIFNYVYEFISGEAIAYECSAKEVRRRHRVLWKLAFWVVVICLTWVLGTKLGSSGKAAGFLNC